MIFSFLTAKEKKVKSRVFSPVDLDSPANSYLMGTGIAESAIGMHLKGKIRISGSWWSALNIDNTTICPGESVSVVGRKDLTLFIQSEKAT